MELLSLLLSVLGLQAASPHQIQHYFSKHKKEVGMDGGKKEDRMRSAHHVTAMLLGLTSTGKLWEVP